MKKLFLPALLFAAMLSGCASSSSLDMVRQDQSDTKSQIYKLSREMTAVRELESSMDVMRRTNAELSSLLEDARSEMRVLGARLDDLGQTQQKTAEELRRYREDTDQRITSFEDRIVSLQGGGMQSEQLDPESLYSQALEYFKVNDMASSRLTFNRFMEQYPDHDLIPNAIYWVGETYFGEKNYEQAVLEFQDVIKQYPKSDKKPAAMLKQAVAFKALKDIKSTRYVLNRLVQEHPKSEEAGKAKALLKELK